MSIVNCCLQVLCLHNVQPAKCHALYYCVVELSMHILTLVLTSCMSNKSVENFGAMFMQKNHSVHFKNVFLFNLFLMNNCNDLSAEMEYLILILRMDILHFDAIFLVF